MKSFVLFSFVICLLSVELMSEDRFVIEGIVKDKSSGKIIPGTGIRIAGTNRGTYTSSKGLFRLYVSSGDTLLVKSIGYAPVKSVVKRNEMHVFELIPVPVIKGNVDVTAEITVEQIIERAVNKRDENLLKLKTFTGDLYSKLVMEFGGSLLSAGSGEDGSFSLSTSVGLGGKEASDSKRFIIMETFSNVQKDYEKKISETTITKRRQTANVPSDQNLMAITDFVSFYDDEMDFLKTKMPSPVGAYGLSSYNYTLKERINQDDRYIYVIDVQPKSELYPGFTGEVRIVEGSYNIIEIDLKPSSTTAIPFFENITVKQKYSESEEKIWYPAFLDITAKVKVEVVKGLLDFDADVKATSIFSDAKLNTALSDSIYTRNRRSLTVSSLADKKDTVFWQNNSLRELSEKETEIYARVDSAVKSDSIEPYMEENISFSYYGPYFDFNRVGSVSLGLSPSLTVYDFNLNTSGYFSFGLQDYFGSVGLELPVINLNNIIFVLSGRVYSEQASFDGPIGSYPRIINTIAAALVHEDYNDYYQTDGFSVNLGINHQGLIFNLSADFARNFALEKNTNISIFEDYNWRKNLTAMEGDFQIGRASFSYGSINTITAPDIFDAEINLNGFLGKEVSSGLDFSGAAGRLILSVPTFSTGYNPMVMFITLSGGITSRETPLQYQHRMGSRLFMFNKMGNFFTAPLGYYGGDEYYSAQVLYNLSDLWWRWLGLPTYEGRGLDLTIGGTFGRFYNNTSSVYRATGDDGYTEAGFGFSRIPTFFSNLIFWSFDLRFGIGPNAEGRTGGAVSVALPF